MDLRNMLNAESVDPTPPSRRFSSSQTPTTESPIQQNGGYSAGNKRPMSSSTMTDEPSPKKVMTNKKRPLPKPKWAERWTEEWHRHHSGKNGVPHRPSPRNGTSHPPPSRTESAAMATTTATATAMTATTTHIADSALNSSAMPPPPSSVRPEPSYLNIYPNDELSRIVADFIYHEVYSKGWLDQHGQEWEVEIEAKLGTIIDRSTNERIHLPVRHECALNDAGLHINFRSSMTSEQHRKMNEHLNNALVQSIPEKSSGRTPSGVHRQPIFYKHLYELDKFFTLDSTTYRELPPRLSALVAQAKRKPRIRITWNTKTDQVVAKVIKIRLADLHVYSPLTQFDWRLSASVEYRYDGEVNSLVPAEDSGRAKYGRKKDRMSYTHQGIRIDLTQVTMAREDESGRDPAIEKEHELELEYPIEALKEEVAKMPADTSGLMSLTKLYVDDVRVAIRQFKI